MNKYIKRLKCNCYILKFIKKYTSEYKIKYVCYHSKNQNLKQKKLFCNKFKVFKDVTLNCLI